MTHPIQQQQNPEPWVPEGMPEWKVGMRVRWRISSECGFKCLGCGISPHSLHPDTGEGIIDSIVPDGHHLFCEVHGISNCGTVMIARGHTYEISALSDKDLTVVGFWAAASELVLLSDEGRKR